MMEMEKQRKMARIKTEEMIEVYFESRGYNLSFFSDEEMEYFAAEYEKYVFKKWKERKAKKEKYEEYIYFAFDFIERNKKYAKYRYKKNEVIEKDKKDLHKREKAMIETIRGKKKKPQIRRLTVGNLVAYSRLMKKIIFGWTDIYSLNFNDLEEIVEENETVMITTTTDTKKVEDAIFDIQKKIFGVNGANVMSGRVKKLI